MATNEEMDAAVQAALDALSSADRQNTVKRFKAMFFALAPFLPQSELTPEHPPDATLLLSFRPSDEMRPEVERLNRESMALMKRIVSAPPQSGQREQPAASEADPASPHVSG